MRASERRHFKVSMVKSAVRVLGYMLLLADLSIAIFVLIMAECLGLIEEIV